jgi:hypothetical protein
MQQHNTMTAMLRTGGEDSHSISRWQLIDFMQAAYDWGYDDAERELATAREMLDAAVVGSETHLAPN